MLCSTSARRTTHAGGDGRVRADVGVLDQRARADDGRPAHRRAHHPRARLDHHAALDRAVASTSPSHAGLEHVEDEAVGLEHVLQAAGVLPPAGHHVRLDAQAAVDEVLDGVGDLELAARRGPDRLRRLQDRRGEHVDAHQREVARRLRGLLHQPHDPAVLQLGDAVGLGVGTCWSRIMASRPPARNSSTRAVMPSRSRLSPRYITNGESPRNSSAVSTAWARPSGASCADVGDLEAEAPSRRRRRPRSRRCVSPTMMPDLASRRRRAAPRARRRAPACSPPARAASRWCA